MSYVFVSYCREDADAAGRLIEWLETHGFPFWWDKMLKGGESHPIRIREALDSAACAIVCWSDAATQSAHVYDEADRARRAGLLIPVASDEFDLDKLPLGFGSLQVIRMHDIDALGPALARCGLALEDSSATQLAPRTELTIGATLARMKRKLQIRIGASSLALALAIALGIIFPTAILLVTFVAIAMVAVVLFLTS